MVVVAPWWLFAPSPCRRGKEEVEKRVSEEMGRRRS